MKHRDFHAGQSALGLMARNTEAMFAPRMAQWEAFGKGLQDANAIVQNRHAFNEQLEQNRIQNEFKNKEFGFREKELQENQRQFDQRHALDKENSFHDNKLKQSQADYNYWRMTQEKEEKERQLSLKSKGAISDLSNGIQLLRDAKKIMQEAPNIKGISFGASKILNETFGSLKDLPPEYNAFIGRFKAFETAYLNDKFGKALSQDKIDDFNKFLNQSFAGAEQFNHRMAEVNLSKVEKMEDTIRGYKNEMGGSDEFLSPIEADLKELKDYFTKYREGETTGRNLVIIRYPTKQELAKER